MNKKQGMPGGQPGSVIAVVGKQTGLTALVEQLQKQENTYKFRLYPDLGVLLQDAAPVLCVLIDLSQKAGFALDAFAELKIAMPRIPILPLTDRADTSRAIAAVEQGACDYLFLDEVSLTAIRLACNLYDSQAILKNNQASYLSVFESNPNPVLLLDLDGNIVNVNEAGCRLTDYSAEEMRHTHFSRYVFSEDLEKATATFIQSAHNGKATSLSCRIVRKDGTIRQCEITRIPMTSAEVIMGIIGVIRDITELIQAQQEAEANALFLSKQIKQLDLLYAISNVMAEGEDFFAIKQRIIELIPGSLKHLGITGARLNQGNRQFVSSDFDGAKALKTFNALSQGTVVAQLELCSDTDQSFSNADISLFGIIAERLGRLISRHQMAEELQEHQQRLEFAMQAADLGYWEHDLITGKAWWSQKTAQLFGKNPPFDHTLEELVALIYPEDRDKVKQTFADGMANYGRAEAEYRIILPNGEIRWLHDRGQCIQDGTGRYTKMIGVVSDITDRKQADEAIRTSEEIFHSTYTHAPVGIVLINKEGRWIEINQKYCDITGYSRKELLNSDKKFIELTDSDFHAQSLEHIRQLESGEKSFYSLEKRLVRKDGTRVWVRVTASCVRDVAGALQFYTAVVEDITERRQAKEDLVKSESAYRKQTSLLETVLGSMSEGVLYLDKQQQVVWANPAAKQIMDLATSHVTLDQWPQTYGIYLPDMHTLYPADNLPMIRALRGELVLRDEMVIRQPGQTAETWVSVNASPLRDSAGRLLGGLIVMRDITVRKQAEYRLALSLHFDALTGLPNRNTVFDRLNTALCHAVQLNTAAAVLRIDLDHFSDANERFGYETADRIFAYIGQQLKGCIRETDTIGRYSGDEFIIVLDNIPDSRYAEQTAHNILNTLSLPIRVDGIEINQHASIGIAIYPEHGTSSHTLIHRAHTALRHAKAQGRNNAQFYFAGLTTRQIEILDLKADLRKAIDNDELVLHYQPQLELGSGLITGVEALIRWSHPRLGLLSPSQFISLAEDGGILPSIGEWVLTTACRQAVLWQEAGLAPIKVGVKVSALQLRQRGFAEEISGIVQATGFDPAYLDLEISEGLLAQDIPFSIEALKDLKGMGVQLTLDDFGSGYSSLNYLFDLPLDTIRFDGAFVRYLLSEDFHPKLARTVISLAHSVNMQVMAEGVETQDQLSWLKQHRCDVAQGHLISYPLTAGEITEFLKKKRKLM